MKKVLVLSVVAIAILAVASFASLSFSGSGSVSWNVYPFQNNFVSVSPSVSLNVSAAGTGYAFSATLFPSWSLSDLYFTIPLVSNLSLVTGYEGNFGESVFGGSAVNGTGALSFGYSAANYAALQYTTSSFNAYVQTTGLRSATSVSAFADAAVGPAHVYFGAYPNYTSLYAGASASMGPATLFGLLNYASGEVSSYTVGAAANMGSNQLGAEYAMGNNITAWFDYGSNVEVNAQFSNMSFSSANLIWNNIALVDGVTASLSGNYTPSSWSLSTTLSKTLVGNVSGSLTGAYSSASGLTVTSSVSVSAF